MVKARDEEFGVSTEAKRDLRKGYLPEYEAVPGADEWKTTGKGVTFEPIEREFKQ
jgi:hypothetical protein